MLTSGMGDKLKHLSLLRDIDLALSDTPEEASDAPVATGDPVVDEWERQFARGELPAWMVED